MTLDLNGKSCIVTGAARGIGAEIAKRYVQGGAKVAIADLDLASAQATAKELTEMGPGEAMGIAMNVTDEEADLSFDRERGGRARLGFNVNQPRTFGVTMRMKF